MHEDAPTLTAKKRDRVGSRYAQRVRQRGGLPAIVYGHGEEPVAIELDAHEARLHFDKGERVFSIAVEGAEGGLILLQDLQFDYLGTEVVHADFRRVDLSERVDVTVPLEFVGNAKGLKTAGAILVHPVNDIELECAVTNLPEVIEVDVSHLDVGDHLTAGEVTLPKETMKLRTPPETTIALITVKAETEDEGSAEGETVEASTQPEVLTEKKKEEGDE
ncbi:MAG: 50S ribosomal protein L25 [Planctomycetota bacterium]